MRTAVYLAGVSTMCLAGWLTITAWACDHAGQALIHIGDTK
ncbi:hypothetical protein OED52_13835 [Rhodococcus sp. Z13]|uniref:Uncharacterized protein n=1 Tax=Rhodococcus sacchari TaxID=2962047 RepID=A0ACD4DCG8_9NOCA|nr:hypothetical protein [Rhodococcus sp. Z13]UYP17753.1 hypothetical protein OED52_13835 [Rhodococcus sp. Z13]